MPNPLLWIAITLTTLSAAAAQIAPKAGGKDQVADGYDYGKYVFKVEVDPKLAKPKDDDAEGRLIRLNLLVASLRNGYGLPLKQKLEGVQLLPGKPGVKELEARADSDRIGLYLHVEVSDLKAVQGGKKSDPRIPNPTIRHRMWIKTMTGWRSLFDGVPIMHAETDPLLGLKLIENPLHFAFPQEVFPIRITSRKRLPNGSAEFSGSITNHHILPMTGFKLEVVGKVKTGKEGDSAARHEGALDETVNVAPGKSGTFRFAVSRMSDTEYRSIDGVLATEVILGK